MDSPFVRSLKVSTILHFVVVLLLIVAPAIYNRRLQKQRKEIVTFVDFTVALPEQPPTVTPVKDIRPPEPPKPKVEPPKRDVPETVKPKPKIERSTNRVVRTAPKPATPPLSQEEIKKLLAAGARISDRTSIPADLESGMWYYATVRQIMYDAWPQPGASVPAGTTARVEIRVMRDGTVVRRTLAGPSGNNVMDQSVMRAVEAVPKLPPLPAAWNGPWRDISIEFVLER